jgi:hypothetical protein
LTIKQSRGGPFSALDRVAAERLIGAPLPKSATNVQYLRWQPSGDLAYHEALVQWESPKEDYIAFVSARGLTPFSTSGPDVHLPIDWRPASQIDKPEWWNPTPETPADAASGQVGTFGSIAAKWEADRVYVMITDTGHRG